jgi:hypothetical protein
LALKLLAIRHIATVDQQSVERFFEICFARLPGPHSWKVFNKKFTYLMYKSKKATLIKMSNLPLKNIP